MTQTDRVLRALRNNSRGITQVDFMTPDVIDFGPPITRVAARILELRDQGYVIKDAGRRHKCRVYQLVSEPVQAVAPVPVAPPETPAVVPGRLFDAPPPVRARSHYDLEDAA